MLLATPFVSRKPTPMEDAMNSLYLLIPIAVIFVTVAIAIFFWAVDNNQFDDLEGPAHSILFDEPEKSMTEPDNPINKTGERSPR